VAGLFDFEEKLDAPEKLGVPEKLDAQRKLVGREAGWARSWVGRTFNSDRGGGFGRPKTGGGVPSRLRKWILRFAQDDSLGEPKLSF
jgi:hypothetical protein